MQEGIDFLYCNVCLSLTGESEEWQSVIQHSTTHNIKKEEYQEMFQHSPIYCVKVLPNITKKNLSLNKQRYQQRFKGKEGIDFVYCQICKKEHNTDRDKVYNVPYYKRRFHYVNQHLARYHHLDKEEIKEYESSYTTIAKQYHKVRSELTNINFNNPIALKKRKEMLKTNNPMNNPASVAKLKKSIRKYYKTEEGKQHIDLLRFLNKHDKERANKISITKTDWDFYIEHGTIRSKFPYDVGFNKKLKTKIAKRDNFTCQRCKDELPFPYHIHHIDYDKTNTSELNLILLCNSCHSKTNYNREYWKKLFKEYQKERALVAKDEDGLFEAGKELVTRGMLE